MLALLLIAQLCPAQKLEAARFPPGESLEFRLDALGADVGTFDVHVEAPPASQRPRTALVLKARAKTNAFVSTNVKRFDALVTAQLGQSLLPLRYQEEIDEGEVHKGLEIEFPPRAGSLPVRASKNGEPEALTLQAGEGVRDILSTLYLLRAQPLKEGAPVCVEVVAGRKIWRLTGAVGGREIIETPLGKFSTVRIDAVAVRADDGNVKRGAHVWVTDDARRLPLVAIGDVRGKTIRAQLVQASGGGPALRMAQDGQRKLGR